MTPIRTAEFALAFGAALSALAFGSDVLLLAICLSASLFFALLGVWTWPDITVRRRAMLTIVAVALLALEGFGVYAHAKTPAPPQESAPTFVPIAKLFQTDFPDTLGLQADLTVHVPISGGATVDVPVKVKVHYNVSAGAKFYSIYIPSSDYTFQVASIAAAHMQAFINPVENTSRIKQYLPGGNPPLDDRALRFSGTVYIYHETDLTPEQRGVLHALFDQQQMSVEFAGSDYALEMWKASMAAFNARKLKASGQ